MAPVDTYDDVTTLVLDFFETLGHCKVDIPAAIAPVLRAAMYTAVKEALGWPANPDDWTAERGWPDVWMPYDRLRLLDYRGRLSSPQLWSEYVDDFLRRVDRHYATTFKVDRRQLLTNLQLAEIGVYAKAELMPDAEEFLRWAATRYRLILCSNAGLLGWETIRRLVPPGLFTDKDLAVSYLMGEHKLGHKDGGMSLFATVIASMLIHPANSLVVDDERPNLDVCDDLGYQTVQVKPGGDLESLTALRQFIESR